MGVHAEDSIGIAKVLYYVYLPDIITVIPSQKLTIVKLLALN